MMAMLAGIRGLWGRRHELVLGLLIVSLMLIYCCLVKIRGQAAALAARPAVIEKEVVRIVKGPTRTVEKIRVIREPGQVEVVETTREVIVESEETVRGTERSETPIPRTREPKSLRLLTGFAIDRQNIRDLRGGLRFHETLDLVYGYGLQGPGVQRHSLAMMWAWGR